MSLLKQILPQYALLLPRQMWRGRESDCKGGQIYDKAKYAAALIHTEYFLHLLKKHLFCIEINAISKLHRCLFLGTEYLVSKYYCRGCIKINDRIWQIP